MNMMDTGRQQHLSVIPAVEGMPRTPIRSLPRAPTRGPESRVEGGLDHQQNHMETALGCVDISSQPYEGTDEMEESEVSVRQLVEPGEDATEMLDLADEAFDQMTLSV